MVPDALSDQAAEDAAAYAATIVECQEHLIDAARRIEALSAALEKIVELAPPDGLSEAQALAREALTLTQGT